MNRAKTLIFGVLLLHLIVVKSAPRDRRWIPERMSDSDYGMETHAMPSSDGAMLNQPNYLTYWSDYFPGGYNGGDYNGMLFRANQDTNHGVMMDPVQQLQNVQAYSYAQSLRQQYPYAVPYPYHQPPPSGPYQPAEASPTGRSLLTLDALNLNSFHSLPQSTKQFIVNSSPSSSQSAFFTGSNQRPIIMSNGQILSSSLISSAGQPQMVVVLPENTQSQLPTSFENFDILNEGFPTESALDLGLMNMGSLEKENALLDVSALDSTASKENILMALLNNRENLAISESNTNSQVIKALIEASILKRQEQEMGQEIEHATELSDAIKNANSQAETQKEVIVIEEGSTSKHQPQHQHQSQKHQKEVIVIEEGSTSKHQPQHQHQSQKHEKQQSSSQDVEIKVVKATNDQSKNFEKQQTETVDIVEKESHSHPQSQSHQKNAKEAEKIVVKVTETEKESMTNQDATEAIVEEQLAKGRAHEESGTYPSTNYGTNPYNSSPLDLVYPGAMVPAQNRPTGMTSSYYQPPQYGQQQYVPQSASTSSGSPYSMSQAYQPQPAQYAPSYYPTQSGSYSIPLSPTYYPGQSSYGMPSYSNSYNYQSPPRVTRNSVVTTPNVVRYVYGSTIFPQYG